MGNYDKAVHSKSKLGIGTLMIVAPMMPTGAQMNAIGMLHLRLQGEAYITSTLRGTIAPSKIAEVLKAVTMQPDEMSYSGSDSLYKTLEVVDVDGTTAKLMAGKVMVAKVYVDPEMELVSSDESIADQIGGTVDPDEDLDQEDNPDENE